MSMFCSSFLWLFPMVPLVPLYLHQRHRLYMELDIFGPGSYRLGGEAMRDALESMGIHFLHKDDKYRRIRASTVQIYHTFDLDGDTMSMTCEEIQDPKRFRHRFCIFYKHEANRQMARKIAAAIDEKLPGAAARIRRDGGGESESDGLKQAMMVGYAMPANDFFNH